MGGRTISLADIERILAGHEPALHNAGHLTQAAVALILRGGPGGPHLLFIERAAHDGDPWSGDLAFPGGKIEAGDGDPRSAAERETREEIGFDLRGACCLGRLSDVVGAHLPVRVSCFVYATGHAGPFRLNSEVRDTFWVPLAELLDDVRHVEAPVRFGGKTVPRPAIRLSQGGKPVLWGITYRLVMEFLALLGGEAGQ